MASADDAHSRPKRPTAMTRQSSSQSHLSEGEPQRAPHKAQRQHVVGHQRVQRNLSTGKNLNKLNKAAQQMQQAEKAAEKEARHHRRTKSGDSVSAPSSPRPSFKRNASSGAVVRVAHQAHTQANLRRNHSSGQLPRTGQGKHALKSAKNELASGKKSLTPARSRQASPEPHAAVHFDMGDDDDDEGGDEGWTEESASQSPTTTRSNTRSNSVILDAQHKLAERNMENNRGDPAQVGASRQPPAQSPQTLPDRSRATASTNGSNSHHARLPDADIITSRLLQRSASHTVPPQTTSVAATVGTATERHTTMAHSAGSTLVDTPGKDLVSRFMDGDGSAGTPHDGGYMPASQSAKPEDGELDQSMRNKSMPNVNAQDTPNRTPSRSGTTTPTTNLPPSRTQQKLMLQRASSNIEPQKLVPVTLPRTGGPTFLQSGINYNANGEGRLDPRLQQQFNHVAVEYNVVRRYRNPVADSILRIQQIPGVSRKTRIPRTGSANGSASAHSSASLRASFSEAGMETDGASSRRSARVSFDNEHGRPKSRRDDGDVEGHQSFESARSHARPANEAEEICRRLWESAEIMEAD